MRTQELNATLAPLVERGEISAEQASAVHAALASESVEEHRTRRHILSEVLSYVGGALIVISGAFIVAQTWETLGVWGQFALVGIGALILFVAAQVLSIVRHDDTSRRLTGTLFVGAAALAAVAVGSLLRGLYLPEPFIYSPGNAWKDPGLMSVAAACALVIAVYGYARVRTVIGQAGIAIAAAATLMGAGTAVKYYQDQSDIGPPTAGLWLVFALGIGWIAISRVGAFAEQQFALVTGAVLVLFGSQAMNTYDAVQWVSSSLLLALGAAFLALYLWWREWPMLAAGIFAILEGGIQLFVTYLEGLGAAIGSLALGIVLLAVGVYLLRGRRRKGQSSDSGPLPT